MYIIHRPTKQDLEQERTLLEKPVGKQTRVRDQIATVNVTNQDNRDE